MPCDTVRQKGQSLSERKAELKKKAEQIAKDLAAGRIRMKVGPQGAVAFVGQFDRGGMTDACIYRRVMAGNNVVAKLKIAAAGPVSKVAIGQGIHSHDGGSTWHNKG